MKKKYFILSIILITYILLISCVNSEINILTDDILIYNLLDQYKNKNKLDYQLEYTTNIDKKTYIVKKYDLIFSKYYIDINLKYFSKINIEKIEQKDLYDFFKDFYEKNNKKIIPYSIDFLIIKYIDNKYSNISEIKQIFTDPTIKFIPYLSKIDKYEFFVLGDNLFFNKKIKIDSFKSNFNFYYSKKINTEEKLVKYRNIDKNFYLESNFFNINFDYISNTLVNPYYKYNILQNIYSASIKQNTIFYKKFFFKDQKTIYKIINFILSYETQKKMVNFSLEKSYFLDYVYIPINKKSLLDSNLQNKEKLNITMEKLYYPYLGPESIRINFFNYLEYLLQLKSNDKIQDDEIISLIEKKFKK